jgi:phage tail P2-like protein
MNALLPANASELEAALVGVNERVLDIDADIVRRAKDPATCPEVLLPWLAWEETVDIWEPDWPVARKREAIAQSWHLHRHKGTRRALEDAINLLGYGARLEEWFEYGGAAYHFRVRVEIGSEDALALDRMILLTRTALQYKNVRSHLESIFLQRPAVPTAVYVGSYIRLKQTIRTTYDLLTDLGVSGRVYFGSAAATRQRVRLG